MPETSTLTALAERLKQRNEEELKQIERIEKDALERLSRSLRKSIEAELNTLQEDTKKAKNIIIKQLKETIREVKEEREEIEEEVKSLRTSKLMRVIWPVIVGLLISMAAAGGLWATLKFMDWQIERKITRIEELNMQLKEAEEKIDKTPPWVTFDQHADGTKYLIMPVGWELVGNYTAKNGAAAYKMVRR